MSDHKWRDGRRGMPRIKDYWVDFLRKKGRKACLNYGLQHAQTGVMLYWVAELDYDPMTLAPPLRINVHMLWFRPEQQMPTLNDQLHLFPGKICLEVSDVRVDYQCSRLESCGVSLTPSFFWALIWIRWTWQPSFLTLPIEKMWNTFDFTHAFIQGIGKWKAILRRRINSGKVLLNTLACCYLYRGFMRTKRFLS